MSAADYHADPAWSPSLSSSIATIIDQDSPAHAWHAHPRLNPDYKATVAKTFDMGTAAHALMLEGGDGIAWIERDDYRSDRAKSERQRARDAGKVPVLRDEGNRVRAMVNEGRTQLAQVGIGADFLRVKDTRTERVIIWRDAGVLCRARLDRFKDDGSIAFDYKTTGNAPQWAPRNLFPRYAIQAAMYRRAVKYLFGKSPRFIFIVQETAPPYAVSFVELSPSALRLANTIFERARDTWQRCLKSDVWPGYSKAVFEADAPAWIETREIEREVEHQNSAGAADIQRAIDAQAPV